MGYLVAVANLQQTRIARNVSQQGIGAKTPAATRSVMNLLDTVRHQRSSGAAKPLWRQTASSPRAWSWWVSGVIRRSH